MKSIQEKVEQIIEEQIRPKLKEHGGDIKIVSIEDGLLKVAFLGACKGCPGVQDTIESVVESNITQQVPEIKEVKLVNDVSPELWDMAKNILKGKGK